MSFASEPGRDDGSLPPVNIVIPDDARDLERDVLAYRREVRAQRRRQRLLRLLRPVGKTTRFGGHIALVPLIAIFLALSLIGAVVAVSPASAPTLNSPSAPATGNGLTALPAGRVQLDGHGVQARSLVSSAIALVPAHCGCEPELRRLADQATAAGVTLYFVGTGVKVERLHTLAARDGDGAARVAADPDGVFARAYHPVTLTVLLVFSDATAEVHRNLVATFQFGPTLSELGQPGASRSPGHAPSSQPSTT